MLHQARGLLVKQRRQFVNMVRAPPNINRQAKPELR